MKPRVLAAVYGDHQQALVSELLDYEVRVPLNPMDAIAASEQSGRRFDLLIFDAEMPESFEAAEYAKDLGWRSSVVFISAVDDLSLRLKAAEIGCDAFLCLSEELSQLRPIARALLESSYL
jgi:DNA-binding response OmpR family regulator